MIDYFELENLKYSPRASWDFYEAYRAAINEMKSVINEKLKVENAAFCGFLMMSLER